MDSVATAAPCPGVRLRRRPRQRGFTLLDAGLGVIGLALASALAFTSSARREQAARCVQLADELRGFATAFQNFHAARHTRPPANVADTAIPGGMEPWLRDTRWLERTPFGGHYRWTDAPIDAKDNSRGEIIGTIMVTAFSPEPALALTPADLHRIDVMIDDGDLATGDFRAGFNGWPVLLVRAKK